MLGLLHLGEKMAWRSAMTGLAAVAEAMFPEGVGDAPDWKTTHLVERTVDYLDELPPAQRRLLILLYATIELGGGVLSLPRRLRFSKLDVQQREDTLRRWRKSPLLPVSIIADAAKANMTMMYMAHPDVLVHIGMYKTCEHPDDALTVPLRPNALKP